MLVKANKRSSTNMSAKAAACSTAPSPLGGARFLQPKAVMGLLGYTDRSAFWQAVRSSGIPVVRVNSRRFVFEEAPLRAWLDSRTIGGIAT